jgi:uncharacterized protein (DUF2062 family)
MKGGRRSCQCSKGGGVVSRHGAWGKNAGMLSKVIRVFQKRVVQPVLELLRIGATPHGLAWALAVGVVVGVNPLLGSTTLIALALAGCFRLNVVASQIGNHVVYPLELLLFPVWVKLGSLIFGTPGIPLHEKALMEAVRHHPWETTRKLWMWEWHALAIWAVCAAVVAPLLQMALLPLLKRMVVRLHDEAVMEK